MIFINNYEFSAKVKNIATNCKTLYVLGCPGAPLNAANRRRYTQNYSYNRRQNRVDKISSSSSDIFGFDDAFLVKSVLWGWNGNKKDNYGGAKYESNGVPDIGADAMIKRCSDVSTNFNKTDVGEIVWRRGHVGVYIGNGLAVECSSKWADKVQITGVSNISENRAYNNREWTKHGKLPYINYISADDHLNQLAREVINGKWGSGDETKRKITEAGYSYDDVINRANEILVSIRILVGDIYGNKKIASSDARLILRAALSDDTLYSIQNAIDDSNKDKKMSAAEARSILQKAVVISNK